MTMSAMLHKPVWCDTVATVPGALNFGTGDQTVTLFCYSAEQAEALRFAFDYPAEVLEHKRMLEGGL